MVSPAKGEPVLGNTLFRPVIRTKQQLATYKACEQAAPRGWRAQGPGLPHLQSAGRTLPRGEPGSRGEANGELWCFSLPDVLRPWTRLLPGETGYNKFLVFWQELIILTMLILYLRRRAWTWVLRATLEGLALLTCAGSRSSPLSASLCHLPACLCVYRLCDCLSPLHHLSVRLPIISLLSVCRLLPT